MGELATSQTCKVSETLQVSNGFKETEIGPIPVDWDLSYLGEVASLNMGQSPPSSTYNTIGEGMLFLQGKAEFGRIYPTPVKWCSEPKKVTTRGSVLISVRAPVGDVNVAKDEYCIGRGLAAIDGEDALDNWFLFYLLTFAKQRFEDKATGSTFKSINKGVLQNFPIPLPPLPEQRCIAPVLSTIQRAIAAQDDLIAAARETKRSLMHRLFTYGPGLDPAPTKETEIGEIPEHWEMVELENVLREKIKNGAFVKRDRFGTGIPFLNVADTYDEVSVSHHGWERVEATERELGDYSLQPNDLFFVRSSLKREGIGQCCIVEEVPIPAIYDCHLMRVRVEETQVIPKFLAYYAASPQGKDFLIKRSKTTTMTTINQRGLGGFEFPLSPLSEQQEIVRSLEAADAKTAAEEQRKSALEALFQSTLQQLMTGQIRLHAKADFHRAPF